jgi:hypothetical protein
MAKQTVFVPNTIASWQSRLIRDKANCYGTKHDCFMTMQIDARQSKRLVHQTRLLRDKAGSKAALRQRGLSAGKASPLRNWLIYELQPARFFSLLAEQMNRLRNKRICAI